MALELQELSVQPNFDVAITGFETAEVDILIGELSEEAPDEADIVPEIDRIRSAISQPGDLWRIGDHTLLCGNALDGESYKRLLGSAKAQLGFPAESAAQISETAAMTAASPDALPDILDALRAANFTFLAKARFFQPCQLGALRH